MTDDYWEKHLRLNNIAEVERIVANYPKDNVVNIDVSQILNNEVWRETMENPGGVAEDIRDAMKHVTNYPEERWHQHNFQKVIVRYTHVAKKVKIKDLRHEDERRLISIKALVKRASPVRPKVTAATFQCDAGHLTVVTPKFDVIQTPKRCTIADCELRTFDHRDARDQKVNRQWLYVQDPLEDLTEGGTPNFLKCEILEDLCGRIAAGDRVVVNGVYRTVPIWKQGTLTATKDVFFDVSSIELSEREFEELRLTEEDEKTITELAAQPNIYERLIASVAPSILGMRLMKEAIVLTLFEGVTQVLPDGTVNRGHINVLCVSDPSMAKTKLLRFVASVAPRGVFTNATTSTKVGLVAPIVRDETTGEYTVQAGAYMIASGGILCLDEVSELDKGEFKYLNEAMEDGEAHITKAGLNITVKTRASLLAACNPTEGSFDSYRPLAEQVKIPESTLSRFDLKILLQDVSTESRDRATIEHITATHMGEQDFSDYLTPEILRKYVAMGRRHNPKLTKASKKVIDDYYVSIRKETGNADTMKITPRQGTACIRLAEARARVRLSDTVTVEDAKAAVELFDLCFRNVTTDPVTGKIDVARSDHRAPRDSIISNLMRAIREAGSQNGATEEAILSYMHRFDKDKVLNVIRDLKREGKIIEPRDGLYKVM